MTLREEFEKEAIEWKGTSNLFETSNQKYIEWLERRIELQTIEPTNLITNFIDWAKDCGEDAFYVFEETEEAIELYLQQKDY